MESDNRKQDGPENAENFVSPPANKFLDRSLDHAAGPTSHDGSKKLPCTPAIQRLHNTLREFNVHSPSDDRMSPCSQKLANDARVRKGHQSHNEALQKTKNAQKAKYGKPVERPLVDFDADEPDHCVPANEEEPKN